MDKESRNHISFGRERHQEARFRTGHTRGHPGWKQRLEGNAEADGGATWQV